MRLTFLLSFILLSCGRADENEMIIITSRDTIKIGHKAREGIVFDTLKYYSDSSFLEKIELYESQSKLSKSISYHSNGQPFEITNYCDGLKHGKHVYYDSLGYRIYEDHFYYGLIVGNIIIYNKKEILKRYFFSNLQNQTVFDIRYDDWNGVDDIAKRCINYTVQEVKEDTNRQIHLLIYLPNPPKFSFQYSICLGKEDAETDSLKEVKKLSSNLPFLNIHLPAIDASDQYVVKLSIYDSLLNQKSVVYKAIY